MNGNKPLQCNTTHLRMPLADLAMVISSSSSDMADESIASPGVQLRIYAGYLSGVVEEALQKSLKPFSEAVLLQEVNNSHMIDQSIPPQYSDFSCIRRGH